MMRSSAEFGRRHVTEPPPLKQRRYATAHTLLGSPPVAQDKLKSDLVRGDSNGRCCVEAPAGDEAGVGDVFG